MYVCQAVIWQSMNPFNIPVYCSMGFLYNDQGKANESRAEATLSTHRGRDKMAAISQTTVSNAFPWKKKCLDSDQNVT